MVVVQEAVLKQLKNEKSYFNKNNATIEIQMQVLNLSIFTKGVLQIIRLCFLVHVNDQNDPSFSGWSERNKIEMVIKLNK